MAEINFNQIFDGITLALHRAFPSVLVHGGTVNQDLHPGDFNVVPLAPSNTAQMGARVKRSITFDVIYYPSDKGGRAECLEEAHDLPGVLGTITTPNGDKVHSYKVECNIEDDALHCVVAYAHFGYATTGGDPMETLTIE